MTSTTPNFGLTKLDAGESVHAGSGKFPSDDRDTIDALLYAHATHRHTGAAGSTPDTALTLTASETGGTIPAGTTVRYKYTYVDPDTGETTASPEATVTTRAQLDAPDAPTYTLQSIGGTLEPGLYFYVLTQYVGSSTVETKALNSVSIQIPAGTSTNEVTLSLPALDPDATGFNVYRRGPGETGYFFLASTSGATYIDGGEAATARTLPSANTTFGTNSITVDIPGATPSIPAGFQWKLYRTYSADYTASFLSQHDDATFSVVDVGNSTTGGSPPFASISAPSKIDLASEVQGLLPGSMVDIDNAAFTRLEGATAQEILAFIDSEGVGGGATPGTYFLAASNSEQVLIDAADFACDGVDDQVQFQAAIDDAMTNNIRHIRILLAPGDYTISDSIDVPAVSSTVNLTVEGLEHGLENYWAHSPAASLSYGGTTAMFSAPGSYTRSLSLKNIGLSTSVDGFVEPWLFTMGSSTSSFHFAADGCVFAAYSSTQPMISGKCNLRLQNCELYHGAWSGTSMPMFEVLNDYPMASVVNCYFDSGTSTGPMFKFSSTTATDFQQKEDWAIVEFERNLLGWSDVNGDLTVPVVEITGFLSNFRFEGNAYAESSADRHNLMVSGVNCSSVVVDGNKFYGAGVKFADSRDLQIVDNQIHLPRGHAIHLDNVDSSVIRGNLLIDPGQAAASTYSGIFVEGTSSANIVEGNYVFARTQSPLYGIRINDATCEDNVVRGNVLGNTHTATPVTLEISDLGTNTNTGTLAEKDYVQAAITALAEQTQRVVKSSDETINNSNTPQSDDALTFTVEANQTYVLEGLLVFSASVAAGMSFSWALPSGATIDWTIAGEDDFDLAGLGVGVKRTVTLRGTVVVGATAGSVTLQWAQTAADATDAVVHAGSHVVAEKL